MDTNPISEQAAKVAAEIAQLASTVHVDSLRGAHRARIAAQDLATEVAVLAGLANDDRIAFVKSAGAQAASLVHRYG